MPVKDATTGVVTGTLVLQPDGSTTFTPAPGYSGPVPLINYNVGSSDGQVNPSTLAITVESGKRSPSASILCRAGAVLCVVSLCGQCSHWALLFRPP